MPVRARLNFRDVIAMEVAALTMVGSPTIPA